MESSGQARRRATAWCFVALLLGERAIAIRTTTDVESDTLGEDGGDLSSVNGIGPKEMEALSKMKEYSMEAKAAEAKMTCEQLGVHMVDAADQVMKTLHSQCTADACTFSALDAQDLIIGQQLVSGVAAVADKKECLPSVMGSPEMQQKLRDLLSIVPRVLHASVTEEGRHRIQETYLHLVSFQKGILHLEEDMADRKLLLDFDIPEKECPEPCQRCDHHDSTAFGFRCLLRRADKTRLPELPTRHGVTCAPPQRRWFRWFPFSRQCRVADWRESAAQYVHVSAVLSCATTTMLMGLNAELPRSLRVGMHRVCLKVEQGNALTSEEERQYHKTLNHTDAVVPTGLKFAFNAILVLGIASGLAGLRAATRGNERPSALLERGKVIEPLEPADFSVPFASYLAGEGLVVREEDIAMYSDKDLIQREETYHRLDVCEDVYNLKSQNTFTEGVKPLSVLAILAFQDSEVESGGIFDGGFWNTLVVLGTVLVGFVFVLLFSAIFAVILLGIFTGAVRTMGGSQLAASEVIASAGTILAAGAFTAGGMLWFVHSAFSWLLGGGGAAAARRVETCLREVNTTHVAPPNL